MSNKSRHLTFSVRLALTFGRRHLSTRQTQSPRGPPSWTEVSTPTEDLALRQRYPFGLPSCCKLLQRRNFDVLYDQARKTPIWVSETLTENSLKGHASRSGVKFRPDEALPPQFRSTPLDYRGSGFDRGHLAPAGNNKNHPEAMSQTFLMSNIIPQNHDINSGLWNKLEQRCRKLTKSWDFVNVISGPVMRPIATKDECGNIAKKIIYKVIGKQEVAVPTHLFKVILCTGSKMKDASSLSSVKFHERGRDKTKSTRKSARHALCFTLQDPRSPYSHTRAQLSAFLLPNDDIYDDGDGKELDDYAISFQEIQRISGIEFFPSLTSVVEMGGGDMADLREIE